jgi:hypothetical protein
VDGFQDLLYRNGYSDKGYSVTTINHVEMREEIPDNRSSVYACIAIINAHLPLNDSEKRLLAAIESEIRLAFGLEEEKRKTELFTVVESDPTRVWFW